MSRCTPGTLSHLVPDYSPRPALKAERKPKPFLPPLSEVDNGQGWELEVRWENRAAHDYSAVLMADGRAVPHVALRCGDWMYVLDCRPEEFETMGDLVQSWPFLVRAVNEQQGGE